LDAERLVKVPLRLICAEQLGHRDCRALLLAEHPPVPEAAIWNCMATPIMGMPALTDTLSRRRSDRYSPIN
jgi:hypothetical protein